MLDHKDVHCFPFSVHLCVCVCVCWIYYLKQKPTILRCILLFVNEGFKAYLNPIEASEESTWMEVLDVGPHVQPTEVSER